MNERSGAVTFQGDPLTLLGDMPKPGDKAPEFTVLSNSLEAKSLSDFKEQVLIVAAVPSLDTSVCSREARTFNDKAAGLPAETRILIVSMDLPFAQARWADEAGADRITTLSDHKEASFGTAYGVLVKELRLLARSIFVIGPDRTISHVELVGEMTDEPDYEAALTAASKLG
ncbi:thiol peroxidase [Desulfohalovibrio reitneri]|uniref:thiol peroxidase n=1 Tax=Desulfohalovibrio reitneri TaxID=1307759 RepID=UPI0004A6B1C5|nr:thiol peroxidase [Desulfohalovibrio reitneri]